MTRSPSKEEHDEAVRIFLRECIRPLLRHEDSMGRAMVVYESLTLSFLLLLQDVWGYPPHIATGLVEAALQRAVERLALNNAEDEGGTSH